MARHTRTKGPPRIRGGICLLPGILTTASLFSGFYAIVSAINGQYLQGAVAILVAGIFDGLDGRVARLTGTSSRFGMEYDSLCDLIAFGAAPAILAHEWVLRPYGRFGWLAAFLYVATTALRLARFNSQDASSARVHFTGLPCPAAGAMIATSVLFCGFFGLDGTVQSVLVLATMYCLSALMVSSIPYRSFKQQRADGARRFQILVGVVLLIMVLAAVPQVTLFVLAGIYVLSGPLAAACHLVAREKKTVEPREEPV